MEKQRSRMEWLREGDLNTAVFQAKAKERARSNRIKMLRRADGSTVTQQNNLEHCTINFYRHLFTAQEEVDPMAVVQFVPSKVVEDTNVNLNKPFLAEEIEKAVFMMGPNKAPGPDGFTAGFYQTHWDLVGSSVTGAVLNFLKE